MTFARRASILLLLAAMVWLLWPNSPPPPTPHCPASMRRDRSRSAQIWRRLMDFPAGATLLDSLASPTPLICYGRLSPSVVTTTRVIYLDQRLPFAEQVSRVGHLVHHLHDPIVFSSERDCRAQVRRALWQEAHAIATELRLRRSLGVKQPSYRYAFTQDFWRTKQRKREAVIYEALRAHPRGAKGIPPLSIQYLRRCQELKNPSHR